MKILLVGPGLIEIPSKGWGAVETVIWQLKIHLEKLGCEVVILNKKGLYSAIKAKPWEYDLVHLEYDDYASLWNRLSKIFKFKLIITSHYGYAAWPHKWYCGRLGISGYKKIFSNLLKSPGLIVLSNEIKKTFDIKKYKGFIRVLPNGTEIDKINFINSPSKDIICLGKIESRKKQAELAKIFSNQDEISIDFVGPIVDKNFKVNDKSTHYLGSWDRENVRQKLTEYKALILLSDGEAHALVVGEALAAGLSLIISEEASANLDKSLPFIKIASIEDNNLMNLVKKTCAENTQYRNDIRKYSYSFDWLEIAKRYLEIIKEYLN